MIVEDDFEFHKRDRDDPDWTETMAVVFSVPEENISGHVYVLTRPNLGVCHSSIFIHRGFCFNPWEVAYNDSQAHLPCPAQFRHFSLQNGLSVKIESPRRFVYKYSGKDGRCDFDFTFDGITHPFDTNDPAENPTKEVLEASRVFRRLLFVRRSHNERYKEQVLA